MDNFRRRHFDFDWGRPRHGKGHGPVESHLLRTMRLFERWTLRNDRWYVTRRTRPWRGPVENESDRSVDRGREWKSRRMIEEDFGFGFDSRGNVVRWHKLTPSERREVSRALRNLGDRGILLRKRMIRGQGVFFGINGLAELPPIGWDHIEDFLLKARDRENHGKLVGVRGKNHRLFFG